jgi:hypothetical protein
MIKAGSGEPFKTPNAAKSAATSKGLDEREYKIVEFGDGFAIERIDGERGRDAAQAAAPEPSRPAGLAAAAPGRAETGYRRVKFHPRSSTSEPADVVLSLNGGVLLMPRGVTTILPTPYLEVARQTTYRTFRQEPGPNRKIVVEISQYPYEDVGPATREEYQAMLRKGTLDTLRKLEKSGDLPEGVGGEDGSA